MSAATRKAPDAGATAMPGAETETLLKGTIMTSISDTTELRYSVQGTKVRDWVEERFAAFIHAGVAQLAADWLNSPDGDPNAYEWHGMLMIGDALRIADQMQSVLRDAGWDLPVAELTLALTKAEPYKAEVGL